jgi:Tfp pilus assembly protein PilX
MSRPARSAGVVLPLALLWLLLFSLLLVESLRDAAGERALGNNLQWQRLAFDAAETGLLAAEQRLSQRSLAPALAAGPLLNPSGQASVQIAARAEVTLPPGYSLDRYTARRYEISSTGQGPRNTQLQLMAGVLRVEPR